MGVPVATRQKYAVSEHLLAKLLGDPLAGSFGIKTRGCGYRNSVPSSGEVNLSGLPSMAKLRVGSARSGYPSAG